MKVLFVSAGNHINNILPFIKSQEDSIRDLGVEIDHFSITKHNLRGLAGYFKATRLIKNLVRKNNYQLIHAHYSHCGWAAIFARTGLPVVLSIMGTDSYGFINNQGKRTTKSYGVIISTKILELFVDRIIVKSEKLKNSVFQKRKVSVIPNGVDFEKFKPRDKNLSRIKLKLPTDKYIILFLGNPKDPRKNFKLLSDALTHLTELNLELVAPFIIPAKRIPIYFNVADVFVLTSFLEGSPNVVKEAMASGCPVVATDVGDVSEVISRTKGCYLSEFDPEDLADKIKASLKTKAPTTGRHDISHLQLNQVARDVISLYAGILPQEDPKIPV